MKLISIFFIITLFVFSFDANAQQLTLDMAKGGGSSTSQILRLIALLTILSLSPSILMMVTSFTRIIVVLSLLRSAIGIQQSPPNSVLISLALFLTLFIMTPIFQESYEKGIVPLMEEKIDEKKAVELAALPFHKFMREQVRDEDVGLFLELAKVEEPDSIENVPYRVLIPAFMISELRRAFEIGFLIFLPFLIIDMMVSSVLMAMGMMMLPPVMISLPFKLIFFVLIDGWHLLSESLVKSFGV